MKSISYVSDRPAAALAFATAASTGVGTPGFLRTDGRSATELSLPTTERTSCLREARGARGFIAEPSESVAFVSGQTR